MTIVNYDTLFHYSQSVIKAETGEIAGCYGYRVSLRTSALAIFSISFIGLS